MHSKTMSKKTGMISNLERGSTKLNKTFGQEKFVFVNPNSRYPNPLGPLVGKL